MVEFAGKRIITDIVATGFSDIGPNRSQNQDAIVLSSSIGIGRHSDLKWSGGLEEPTVFAVVDGMGGYNGGADAAAIVAASVVGFDPAGSDELINAFFSKLSMKVSDAGVAWGTPMMGAAFAALCLTEDCLTFINVGDCRIYKLNGGFLGQMSVDDRADSESSALTQAIGGQKQVDAHPWRQAPEADVERYVLCTDGVWSSMSQDELGLLSSEDTAIETASNRVLCAVLKRNAADNCSFIIVEIHSSMQSLG